ncbi:MAG: N-acetyl-gamma-glutamyl-phosphate reductase [Bacteroidetes bacterium]|nr:N-acetyl-gamma-glutamyl-phosphate reductase [Bacteroidota bacterium]
MKNKVKIGIAGGAGYTGGELIRILLNHPNAEISFVHSKSNAGNPVSDVHTDLLGETEMKFSPSLNPFPKGRETGVQSPFLREVLGVGCDVLFLCMGHGESVKFLAENKTDSKIKIIDMSQDFRLNSKDFVYGLPELNRGKIKAASKIANPGCFATAIQLALIPLAEKKLLSDEVHVSAVTGSTGAGQSLSATNHFTWRNNNISIYKAFQHQHLGEITQSIKQLQKNFSSAINFIPYRGNFTRGILASVYVNSKLSLEEAKKLYKDFYKSHPFVTVSEKNPDIKQVVNTNKCILYIEKHGNKLFIQSVIDNLTKGASGQAVQNMNLIFGLDETIGLKLKPSAF